MENKELKSEITEEKKERFVVINTEEIKVTEEVYFTYKRPAWRERKRAKVRRENERSLEAFMDSGFDISSNDVPVGETLEKSELIRKLHIAVNNLPDKEKLIITELYFNKKTERETADKIGVSQNTVNYYKKRILEKLYEALKRFK
jgi:RNA polymerase sigma factor (sigma-70 family)